MKALAPMFRVWCCYCCYCCYLWKALLPQTAGSAALAAAQRQRTGRQLRSATAASSCEWFDSGGGIAAGIGTYM